MVDREKVIKGLEHCANEADCRGCVYQEQMKGRSDGCDCMREALARLKEQPDIVRCKDCKYCEYPNAEKEWCKKGHLHGNAKNWFCADGERR